MRRAVAVLARNKAVLPPDFVMEVASLVLALWGGAWA